MLQMLQLALHDAAILLLQRIGVFWLAQQLHRIGKRRQRVAQLMAEHRQKLVLAPVQLRQRLRLLAGFVVQTGAFGHVVAAGDGAGDVACLADQRHHMGDNRHARTGRPLNHEAFVIHRRNVALEHFGGTRLQRGRQRAVGQTHAQRREKHAVAFKSHRLGAPEFQRRAVAFLQPALRVRGKNRNRSPVEQRTKT